MSISHALLTPMLNRGLRLCSVFLHLDNDKLCPQRRRQVYDKCQEVVYNAAYVFGLDKNIGRRELQFFEDLPRDVGVLGETCSVCKQPLPVHTCPECKQGVAPKAATVLRSLTLLPQYTQREVHFTKDKNKWVQLLRNDLYLGRKVVVACVSKEGVYDLHKELSQDAAGAPFVNSTGGLVKFFVITGDAPEQVKRAAGANVNEAWGPHDCIMYTSVQESGVSYTLRDVFRIYGYWNGQATVVSQFLQMLHRARHAHSHIVPILLHTSTPMKCVSTEVAQGKKAVEARVSCCLGSIGLPKVVRALWRRIRAFARFGGLVRWFGFRTLIAELDARRGSAIEPYIIGPEIE